VFKPLEARRRGVGELVGIPEFAPRTGNRNLATWDVARLLRFDVVVGTFIGTGTLPENPELGPQLGVVMAKAEGFEASDRRAQDMLREAGGIRESIKLQLVDALVAQIDRHSGNYFVHRNADGQIRVTGIDNDQCFGFDVTHPNQIAWIERHAVQSYFMGTLLPPVVDSVMAHAIRSLTAENLRNKLRENLEEAEVEAACSRLEVIKKHIDQLESRDRIIDPDQWGQHTDRLTPQNSYACRDWPD
jgi:hypothetical protein